MGKTIAILGATGSVGRQAVDVAGRRGYKVDFVSANADVSSMEDICRELSPKFAAMADPSAAGDLAVRLRDTDIRVFSGSSGIEEGIHSSSADTVVNSIIGEAGLSPTLAVIDSGKRLALANKESLVIAGDIVMSRAKARGCEIIPVDSEHSAIFQSLLAGKKNEIKRLILTASGGPFFGYTREALERVTLQDALAHPTWKMGKKITVDSATLMNKGFEVIEAAHLFGVAPDRITVTVHRESILHSAVEYIDNSIVAEMSVPDMRMCVQYAVDYPDRLPTASEELDLFSIGTLSFREPDRGTFPFLSLASEMAAVGGGAPAVMNASDEVAVRAFLDGKISFVEIMDTVISVSERLSHTASQAHSLDDIIAMDREARSLTQSLIAR